MRNRLDGSAFPPGEYRVGIKLLRAIRSMAHECGLEEKRLQAFGIFFDVDSHPVAVLKLEQSAAFPPGIERRGEDSIKLVQTGLKSRGHGLIGFDEPFHEFRGDRYPPTAIEWECDPPGGGACFDFRNHKIDSVFRRPDRGFDVGGWGLKRLP